MVAIICPHCYAVLGYTDDSTKLMRGICPECGTKFTAETGLDAVEGWVRVGCWMPPSNE